MVLSKNGVREERLAGIWGGLPHTFQERERQRERSPHLCALEHMKLATQSSGSAIPAQMFSPL